MAAFAMHHNVVLLTACHGDAAARHHHLAQRQRHPGQHMEHDRRVHFRVFQQAVGDHIRGALENLFGRLEFQLDSAFDLLLVLFQQLCRTQHHGRVHIVAAAVHLARHLGGKHLSGLLKDGQGVHIAPEQDGLARALSPGQREDTRPAAVLRRIAHLGQGLLDQRLGLGQVKAHLRVAVDRPPPFLQLRLQGLGFIQQFIRLHHPNIAPLQNALSGS